MEKFKAECVVCGASGLYRGFAEPKGTAAVCRECGGTGCIDVTPFARRRGVEGVTTVRRLAPRLGGRDCPSVTYSEFQQGKMP